MPAHFRSETFCCPLCYLGIPDSCCCVRMWAGPGLRFVVQKLLKEVLGLMEEEVTGGWEKLHTEGLSEFYAHCSPNIVREMEARRKTWVARVGSMAEQKFVPVSDVESSRTENISNTQTYS